VSLRRGVFRRAGCSPARTFIGYDLDNVVYTYLDLSTVRAEFDPNPAAPTGGMIGRLWQGNNRTAANEGTGCLLQSWLFQSAPEYPGYPGYYVNGGLGGATLGDPCNNVGCPAGNMIILVEATSLDGKGAYFAASRSIETTDRPNNYYYVDGVNWTLAPIPKPFVVNSSRGTGTTTLSMNVLDEAVRAGFHAMPSFPEVTGVISGMKIYKYQGVADPGRARMAWGTAIATVPYTGADVPIPEQTTDCVIEGLDTFYAAGLLFDNGAVESDYVSAATQVACSGALANPGQKKVDRKAKGRK